MSEDSPVRGHMIKSWRVETNHNSFRLQVGFMGGVSLSLLGDMLGPLLVDVRGKDAPQDLYEVAKRLNHELGMPWTDPRTGVTHEPPAPVEDRRTRRLRELQLKWLAKATAAGQFSIEGEVTDVTHRAAGESEAYSECEADLAAVLDTEGDQPTPQSQRPGKQE